MTDVSRFTTSESEGMIRLSWCEAMVKYHPAVMSAGNICEERKYSVRVTFKIQIKSVDPSRAVL